MLKKLLKYEFLSTGRIMVPIYLAVLIVSVVTGVLGRGDLDRAMEDMILFRIFIVIYGVLVIAMVILTVFVIVERFYKNMLRGEGYLMHTLPVAPWMLIASKLICALVWELLALVVLFLSLFLFAALGGAWVFFAEIFHDPVFAEVLRTSGGIILLLAATLIVQFVRIILTFYASMSMGGAATRHKLAYSFLAFVVILIVENVISVVAHLGTAANLTATMATLTAFESIDMGQAVVGLLTRQLIMDMIFATVLYLITHYFLKKKLNLE